MPNVAVKKQFQAAWTKGWLASGLTSPFSILTEVASAHEVAWRLPLQLQIIAPWAIPIARRITHPYGDLVPVSARNEHKYGDMPVVNVSFVSGYGDVPTVSAGFVLRYGYYSVASRRNTSLWSLTEKVAKGVVAEYSLLEKNPVKRQHRSGYSLQGQNIQSVAGTPSLRIGGVDRPISEATLSCDESSPYWIASMSLDSVGDYGDISVGDTAELTFGGEVFLMVVDGKSMSREADAANLDLKVSAVSVLALADTPFSGTSTIGYAEDTSARVVVEDQLGPVTWELEDWVIPVVALSFIDATPLSVARQVVGAIGGVVESNPDGSIVCRKKFPVSVQDYGTAIVAHSLMDSSTISLSENIAPHDGFNRVVITNDQMLSSYNRDELEQADYPNSDNPSDTDKYVRAYLARQRPVVLVHTGPASTVVEPLGTRIRTEVETVEFVEGRGSVRYNINTIESVVWSDENLGTLSFDGREIIAALSGYSLVEITYTVRSVDWHVASPLIREIQFVLMDA